jgi:hypothetical protein
MNQTENISPEQMEQMKSIYLEYAIFPTWIHFFTFIMIVFVAIIGLYIISKAVHYKLECKRLKRQIKQMEDELNA